MLLDEHGIHCPYCGEYQTVFIDPSDVDEESYIQDCQVCCRPITLTVTLDLDDDTQAHVEARSEEE
ncbi:MAG TPA: CPXCG motif-containing cysteine-rich protein [Acidobacteria bacterium]|nr:CPXCG motif-containing cysteine-rich protein [Acidobacteriota bacterium]